MNIKTYITVVLGIISAKLIGFLRGIIMAGKWGTNNIESDIYFQVFGLVTLIFTGIGIALQTQVIMNLNKAENSTLENKKRYVSSFLTKCTFYLLIITAALYTLARPITHFLLPDISGANFEKAVTLTYIMLPSFLFVSIAYIISGVLQNNKVFFIPSIMSLPYNIIIITSLFIPGISLNQIGLATTFGWFMHIIILLPEFYRKGYRLTYRVKSSVEKHHSKINMSIWWIFISNMMFQLCFILDKSAVTNIPGMATVLNYASELFITISSVFVVAMSTVVFPAISKNYEEGNNDYVRKLIGYIIIVMFAVFIPFLLVISLFGEQIIGIVYERGEFTHASTVATNAAFVIYSFGILGYLAQELINKVFYLASKYIITIVGTIGVVGLKFALNELLIPNSENPTLTASITTALLLTVYACVAFIALYKIIGNYISKNVLISVLKILIAGISALDVYFALKLIMPEFVTAKGIIVLIPIAICGVVYIAAIVLLGLHKQLLRNPKKEMQK